MKNEHVVKTVFKLKLSFKSAESLSLVTFSGVFLLWRQYITFHTIHSWYKPITLLNTQCKVQPSRRKCKTLLALQAVYPFLDIFFFASKQFALHIVPMQRKVILLTGQEVPVHFLFSSLRPLSNRSVSETFFRWCHPNVRAASLLCCCACVSWKESQVSNSDQTAATNRALARLNVTIVLSADTHRPVMPCVRHFSCGRTLTMLHFVVFILFPFFVLLKQLLPVSMALSPEHSLKWDLCLRLPVCMCITVPPQQKCQHSPKQQQEEDETHHSSCCPSALFLTWCCQRGKRHPMRGKKHTSSDMAALKGQKGPLQYICAVAKRTGTARANRRNPKIPCLSSDHHAAWQIRRITFVSPV